MLRKLRNILGNVKKGNTDIVQPLPVNISTLLKDRKYDGLRAGEIILLRLDWEN